MTNDWAKPDGELGTWMADEVRRTLNSYREQPHRVEEDARIEGDIAGGGYARRQIFELVQNSADALSTNGGRIVVRLAGDFLYCADDGEPIDRDGITALMFSRMSRKRGTSQIGMFGVGFKSVLGVSDAPEFFSRSVSFRFDPTRACKQVQEVVRATMLKHCPKLRLPEPIDPAEYCAEDSVLDELMEWAVNIVRLRIKNDGRVNLSEQMNDFPPEWPLVVEHVETLELVNDHDSSRQELARTTIGHSWKLFPPWGHKLSPEAKANRYPGDERENVKISWAVPLNRLTDPGKFWAFFPTRTRSLVAGILNAPWKTHEDRQNLLPGPYNDELIEVAAKKMARALSELKASDDPARHLDALPRREGSGDSREANLLRNRLLYRLRKQKIVPDQDGILRVPADIRYPPQELTRRGHVEIKSIERWATYPNRPRAWLHHKALSPYRLSVIDRLFPSEAPRATIAEWLEALVEAGASANDPAHGSMVAIQIAALLPIELQKDADLGQIVLTADDNTVRPDPEQVFLPDDIPNDTGADSQPGADVHRELMADRNTVSALKKLGLTQRSPEVAFRQVATQIKSRLQAGGDELWSRFWYLSRRLDAEKAQAVVRDVRLEGRVRIRTTTGKWRLITCVLTPGRIMQGESDRDGDVSVDVEFHKLDTSLMQKFDVASEPQEGRDLSLERTFNDFRDSQRRKYRDLDDLPTTPQNDYLHFLSTAGVGPVDVLALLSDEGRVSYTEALLEYDACYSKWTMKPMGAATAGYYAHYHEMPCKSLTVHMLEQHGRLRIGSRIVPLKDALGPQPDRAALDTLLRHPKAKKIKQVFNLTEPTPEFIDQEDPIPLVDEWPGLSPHLRPHQRAWGFVRCNGILVSGEARKSILHNSIVYLDCSNSDVVDKRHALSRVADILGILDEHVDAILEYNAPEDVARRRAEIRKLPTDAERLLKAVGEKELRDQLPDSLMAWLKDGNPSIRGRRMAEAAIAIWHTDSLRQYKGALSRLDPPYKWAGSPRAVSFVRSLGFSSEWAGERGRRRAPFLKVDGPYTLHKLHCYQRRIVDAVRHLVRGESDERRGMISLPTGAGKTRVAVQAIVEAMRDDGFRGGVLWVADRDELCEQAVEAWQQVWSCKGSPLARLRISRMWGGQARPVPTNELHVVVATIQTLKAKLEHPSDEYQFLETFKLVVFDEAHRSIAPSFTSVMDDVGFTHLQRSDEPLLLGLTATPYRGHNIKETRWLARRYGTNRLDSGAFESDRAEDVVRELQCMGVLAEVDFEVIEGETLAADDISDEERRRPWLPRRVENRIAESDERTKRIVKAYLDNIELEWPTLIFATSVDHARTLTAVLDAKGIHSRAIDGTTETTTRRRVVERFRTGELKALVNYGVFREGFDAPKTRAIIVARPVYSPNLYFQMIGRGLRGPKHGGDERCLVLNVRDNIENWGRALAFEGLDQFWSGQ